MNNATSPMDRKAIDTPAAPAAPPDDVTGDARLEALLSYLERLLPPTDHDAFRRAMLAEPAVDVRVNALLPWAWRLTAALGQRGASPAWNDHVFRLDAKADPGVGHSLEFRLGALYVQARATTLAVSLLDPQPGDFVLDLAAAPGGKATQIAAAMANTGILVANEPRSKRLAALVGNLERCGAHNTLITSALGTELARHFHNTFDRVLLDAPCSGDGIVCKDRGMLRFWSPEDAVHKSVQQIGLLRAAFHMLRPGGRLVYSTCSLSTEENEEVLLGLQKRYRELVDILPITVLQGGQLADSVAQAYPEIVRRGRRVWPHEEDTEGAFVALITKRGASTWDPVAGEAGAILRGDPGAAPYFTAGDTHDFASGDTHAGEGGDGAWRRAPDWADRIAERWDFAPQIPDGHELAQTPKYLHLWPAGAARLAQAPWFVRAGMRVAGLHKDHFYLSQQAVSLWGDQVRQRRLDLTWPQVQILFRGEAVAPAPVAPVAGEVICMHDGIPLCRAVVDRDGGRLAGYTPKVARTAHLHRLLG